MKRTAPLLLAGVLAAQPLNAAMVFRGALPSAGSASLAPLGGAVRSGLAAAPGVSLSPSLTPSLGIVPSVLTPAPELRRPVQAAPLEAAPSAKQTLKSAAPKAKGKAPSKAEFDRIFDGARNAPEMEIPDYVKIEPISGVGRMVKEIREPGKLLKSRGIRATITVFGSARIPSREDAEENLRAALREHGNKPKTKAGRSALAEARRGLRMSKYYEEARRFGALVAKKGGGQVAVVTGGGPGIMEAANRGAHEAGGPSVGYNIALPFEQTANPYVTPGLEFEFENFATRKMNLRHGAVALVFFPGGFGTMDELFEIMTLMQTGKYPKVPIVLFGEKAYWNKILNFAAFDEMGLISHEDLSLFRFADTAEAAWDSVQERHAERIKPGPRAGAPRTPKGS